MIQGKTQLHIVTSVSKRDLDAAGIFDPALRESYELCRQLNAEHGKTYYLATLLLPPAKRPYVHALYGFARYADEIVDDLASTLTESQKAEQLKIWGDDFLAKFDSGETNDPVCLAVLDTVYGSAAVIGLQMVPILEPTSQDAYKYATELGVAFQLANFIRDVGEDLERGRVYLPLAELAQFGVTRADLEARIATPQIKAALEFQVSRVRQLEESSRAGIAMLGQAAQPCIETARILYCGIVDAVEGIDYEVFIKRATVSLTRRLQVALPAYFQARKLWKRTT